MPCEKKLSDNIAAGVHFVDIRILLEKWENMSSLKHLSAENLNLAMLLTNFLEINTLKYNF